MNGNLKMQREEGENERLPMHASVVIYYYYYLQSNKSRETLL
jgi:hypothetical protein